MLKRNANRGPGPCEHCKTNQRKGYNTPDGIRYRPFCNGCYRAGIRANHVATIQPEGCRVKRPAKLEPTGMVIEDATNTLIHADGTRECPVPRWVADKYWLECHGGAKNRPLTIKVLRPAACPA